METVGILMLRLLKVRNCDYYLQYLKDELVKIVKMLVQPFRSGFMDMWSPVAPGSCYWSSLDWYRRKWADLQERWVR